MIYKKKSFSSSRFTSFCTSIESNIQASSISSFLQYPQLQLPFINICTLLGRKQLISHFLPFLQSSEDCVEDEIGHFRTTKHCVNMGKLGKHTFYDQLTGCSMEDFIGNRAFDRKQGCEEALKEGNFPAEVSQAEPGFFSKCSNNTDHMPALGKYG